MGSSLVTYVSQPLLLGLAITSFVIALIYQKKQCPSGPDKYGQQVFNINVILGALLVIFSAILGFFTALSED